MDFVNLKYTGSKEYRDKTALRTLWQSGDIKPVPQRDAKRLLQFAEFSPYKGKVSEQLLQQAKTAQVVVEQEANKDKRELENVHFSIDQMDKDALETYAKQYGVELDKRRSVAALRQEVNGLIELHGVL